jgi:subtilisin family serine protease
LNGDGSYEDFVRYDDTNFYDCRFNGTSAASPVCAGLISLYLETHPTATSREVKTWLHERGTVELPEELLWDVYDDDTQTTYWTYTYNLRGSSRRVLYNPYASATRSTLGPEE